MINNKQSSSPEHRRKNIAVKFAGAAALSLIASLPVATLAQSPVPGGYSAEQLQAPRGVYREPHAAAPTQEATGLPLPGQSAAGGHTAPVPGFTSPQSAPTAPPVQRAAAAGQTGRITVSDRKVTPVIPNPFAARENFYKQLPLTPNDAEVKITELSNRLAITKPQMMTEAINNMCEWMQECADAHWKMHKAFEKNAAMKEQSQQERDTALKFSRLKNKARLLKADLLIKENRYPEALSPLVDIVVAEPNTDTGKEAYKRLVDMGFSEKVANLEIAQTGEGAKK